MVSNTVMEMDPVSTFPLKSVAVNVMLNEPVSEQSNNESLNDKDSMPQLSLVPSLMEFIEMAALPLVFKYKVNTLFTEIVGAVVSITVTVEVAESGFPLISAT